MCALLGAVACKKDKPEPEPEPAEQPELAVGEACDPTVERIPEEELEMVESDGSDLPPVCAEALACEPTVDGAYVCGVAVEIRGRVSDSGTGEPIEGALVFALLETGEPATDVVATDACGAYYLPVSLRRNADGSLAETPKWTLNVSAADYLPFPSGIRPALPVDIADAVPDPDPPPPEDEELDEPQDGDEEEETYVKDVIENGATSVALIALPANKRGGATVSGVVGGTTAPGTLVVAEGNGNFIPSGIADASGAYTVFNVQDGQATIRGYRRDLEVEPTTVTASGNIIEAVDLTLLSENRGDLSQVNGSINIVNAPGGSMTSVVLVPSSVYNDVTEKGPVPVGLRVPDPPTPPNVTSVFSFSGVPSGTYKVLVAFENDQLVRDPDEGIAGTAILEVTLARGENVDLSESFKVTEALGVFSPGREAPEAVDDKPTLVWADDSSEDGYELVVFDALGEKVWETEIPGVSGGDRVEVPYDGDALVPGMYYQFRVTSFRDQPNGDRLYISRTEDLRGVFYTGEAAPPEECVVEDGGTGTGGTGGSGEGG